MLGMLHKTNTITGASHLGAKPFIKLIRFRLTMMIILMSLAWCMMPMEPSLAPLRAPPLWGHFVICNQNQPKKFSTVTAQPASPQARLDMPEYRSTTTTPPCSQRAADHTRTAVDNQMLTSGHHNG